MLEFLSYIIPATLLMGSPIAFTAMGGVISERSGVNNIGLEGIMIASAFSAVVGSYFFNSPIVGILFAIAIGVFISLIHSVVTVTWGANQGVSSMALVLLADGMSGVGLKAIFGRQGSTPQVKNLPRSDVFESIPVIGKFLAGLSPFVYIAIILLVIIHFMFKHTRFGLRITAVGENPAMAETAGLNVHRIRYTAVMLSGALGGLGGAMLSIGQMNLFQEGMVAGRGYLALGAVAMGRWSPIGAFSAAMLFGFFDGLQLFVQTIPGNRIPSDFVQMIPYIASILILAFTSRGNRMIGIASAGKPYTKFVSVR